MTSFRLTEAAGAIVGTYPSADLLKKVAPELLPHEIFQFARLWLTEGIPFAFQRKPIVYEAVRDHFAMLLHIDPKAVTVVGSTRMGFSLAPGKFGEPFGDHSDLDLLIVSSQLFSQFADEFERWRQDFLAKQIQPSNANEARYWDENAKWVPKNIYAGFIDGNKIPRRKPYPVARKVGDALFRLQCRVNSTADAPRFRKVSVRIYKDWPAVMKRVNLNLRTLFGRLS